MKRFPRSLATAALLVACLAGGAVAGRRPPAPPLPPRPAYCPPPDTLAAHTRAMTSIVELLMGGRFLRPVTPVCLSTDAARARRARLLAENVNEARSTGHLAVYGRLGLTPVTEADSVWVPAAWYEPGRDSLWVVADTALAGPWFDEMLVHELVHAFHDQAYDLLRFLGGADDTLTWDTMQARKCVIEGQAQWVQIWHVVAGRDIAGMSEILSGYYRSLERSSLRELSEKQARLERLRRPRDATGAGGSREICLLAWLPTYWYDLGTVFADQLLAAGGAAQLAQALREPPATMKQILRPTLFLGAAPLPRRFCPGPADSLLAGAVELNRDAYGPLLMRLYFEAHGQGKRAGFLTRGWDGDLLLLLGRGEEPAALLWWSVWDASWDAVGFVEGYRATLPARGIRRSMGGDVWRGADPDRRWAVWRDGCRVFIIEDVPAAELDAVREAMLRVQPQAAPPPATTGAPDSASAEGGDPPG